MSVQQATQLAEQLHQAGKLREANALYLQILAVDPKNHYVVNLLGMVAAQAGNLPVALQIYNDLVKLAPDFADGHNNRGNVLQDMGDLTAAAESYRKAAELQPQFAQAHYNLGNVAVRQGQDREAVGHFRAALALQPEAAQVLNNLGTALRRLGDYRQALDYLLKLCALQPHNIEALSNLANTLGELGDPAKAIETLRKALQLQPDAALTHYNLAALLQESANPDAAIEHYCRALECSTAGAKMPLKNIEEAHNNLGNTLLQAGDPAAAAACYRDALRCRPDYAEAHSNLLLCMNYLPDTSAEDLYREAMNFGRLHALDRIAAHANSREPDRQLRIGYVSADWRDHSVMRFILPVFRNYDRQQFSVTVYANQRVADHVTEQLRGMAAQWRDIARLDDASLANLIIADGIDILVDLSGHTAGNRLPMFARKPAPLQLTALGYPGTTGLAAINYHLTDELADPPGASDEFYSERLLRLPRSQWCYAPRVESIEPSSSPALQRGYVTFGSLNNCAKLSTSALALWAQVLQTLPQARLLIAGLPNGRAQHQLLERLQMHGIDSKRIELRSPGTPRDFFSLLNEIDIALDPCPFNGVTTTCDTLWHGVPVVALAGNRSIARGGVSVLHASGCTEWLAHNEAEYVRIATSLAGDLQQLQQVRAGLRQRLQRSELLDAKGYTLAVEQIYRDIWRKWCATAEAVST
jgi:predicted O-linked N-acetylglucosamine transferase (SPINDLY family)